MSAADSEVTEDESPLSINGVRSVAVIGAGVSGILASKYLRRAGLNVTVFERNSKAGGVWIYDSKPPAEPTFPANDPLKTAVDLCSWYKDDAQRPETLDASQHSELIASHAPPGACYAGLTNNFSVLAMELKDHPWPWEIPTVTPENPDHASEWTTHDRILDHVQAAASRFGLDEVVLYRTLVENVQKSGEKWVLRTSTLTPQNDGKSYKVDAKNWEFDAVVVASGHYNTPRIPDIPGLARWREKYPERVQHSKTYRHPEDYEGQNVLLVGGGTSSTEIARELGPFANTMYQSGRGTPFDLPLDMLPDGNCHRVGEIAEFKEDFGTATDSSDAQLQPIPATATLIDGTVLRGIHRVIVCTGYHYAYPFLRELHSLTHNPTPDNPSPLIADGTCVLNLHQDMFYIPDPTLAFVGVSQFISSFTFFEYQTMVVAAVLAGQASLPSRAEMNRLYDQRLKARGATKFMNARMDEEVPYIEKLIAWLESSNPDCKVEGLSDQWHAVRGIGKLEKVRLRFAREKAEKEARLEK